MSAERGGGEQERRGRVSVRLVFVDRGEYRHEEVEIPADALAAHERLIDCLQEDPRVVRRLHVDVNRLAAAYVVEDD